MKELAEVVLLNSESSHSIFCNPKFVRNIRKASHALTLYTNGGNIVIDKIATLPWWGTVWFNDKAITNVISFCEATQRKKVTFDNKLNTFKLHGRILGEKNGVVFEPKDKIYKYRPDPDHLKGFEGRKDLKTSSTGFMKILKENKTFYTSRQQARAKKARALLYFTECSSLNDFRHMVQFNVIKNNSVTMKDIEIAESIFGKDVELLKGKTIKQKAASVVEDYIKILKALMKSQRKVDLCADIMKINEMYFLVTVSKNMKYRTCH